MVLRPIGGWQAPDHRDVTRIFRGEGQYVESGGFAYETNIGWNQFVYAGGETEYASALNADGDQYVSGGVAYYTRLVGGGGQYVYSGGLGYEAFVSSGGFQTVESGGKADYTYVSSGGMSFIYSMGTVSGGTVISGGTLTVSSGGVVADSLHITGGTAVISGTMASGQDVYFAGAGGDLALDNLGGFGAVISGFSIGDEFDLGGFTYSFAETRSWTQNSVTSGTLNVKDGGKVANLKLLGSYVTSDFALSNDLHGGTFVKLV